MKYLRYAIACATPLMGAALANLHLPKGELDLRTYLRVPVTEFAELREEALRLDAEDAALDTVHFGGSYFELNYRGEPALLVDNSRSQLLIISLEVRA